MTVSSALSPSLISAQGLAPSVPGTESWLGVAQPFAPGRAILLRSLACLPPSESGARTDRLAMSEQASGENRQNVSYLPVFYSLLVPGAGEIALGYTTRGIALIALEVASWGGYAYYHDKGLDGRAEFEAFADAHWNYDRWISDHPAVEGLAPQLRTFDALDSIGQYAWQAWPGYHSWASRQEQKLNYYENIGKYDWFISGWEDWDPAGKPMNTDLRDQYRGLRRKSNRDLENADRFVYLSIATRVFSLVETVILVRRARTRAPSDARRSERPYFLTTRATGIASGEVALVYRF